MEKITLIDNYQRRINNIDNQIGEYKKDCENLKCVLLKVAKDCKEEKKEYKGRLVAFCIGLGLSGLIFVFPAPTLIMAIGGFTVAAGIGAKQYYDGYKKLKSNVDAMQEMIGKIDDYVAFLESQKDALQTQIDEIKNHDQITPEMIKQERQIRHMWNDFDIDQQIGKLLEIQSGNEQI